MENDPMFPVIAAREGWRGGMGKVKDGSKESWQASLLETATQVVKEFSNQVSWEFQNLEKFQPKSVISKSKGPGRQCPSVLSVCSG